MQYSYEVNTYVIDTTKRILITSSLISYDEYLFEFRKQTTIRTEHSKDSGTRAASFFYDTIGIYLLGDKRNLYHEFDTFTIGNKLIKSGNLSEKAFGQHYPIMNSDSSNSSKFSSLSDTVINGIRCFYSSFVSNNSIEHDTIEAKIFLIKMRNFNSLYKIGGVKFHDENYCVVGFSVYSLKHKNGFVQELENLRQLTEKEKSICESMITKSKSCLIDTTKEFGSNGNIH